MSPDTIAIIGTGIALAVLMIGLFAWLRADIHRLDERMTRLDEHTTRLEVELQERMTKLEVGLLERMTRLEVELRERMAKLEGLLEGLREAIIGKRAA
jgi:hypothetical protein